MMNTDAITLILAQLSTADLKAVRDALNFQYVDLNKLKNNKLYTEKFTEHFVEKNLEMTKYALNVIDTITKRRA